MYHDSNTMMAGARTATPIDTRASLLASVMGPHPDLFGLGDEQMSLAMTADDETPDWELVKGMMTSAIDLVQMMEGLGKSLIYLELCLRAAWQPTPDELAAAIARSPYAGTTDKNEWLEAALLLSGYVLYVAAEGKLKMHRKRARAILRNNMGVIDRAEQDRILARVRIVSIRSLYADLIKHNPDFKGGMRFFRQDPKTKIYEPTAFYNELMAYLGEMQKRSDVALANLEAAAGMSDDERAVLRKLIIEERVVLMVVDTFGAVWGVRAVDDEGLQAVNQRVNADGDRLLIAIPVIAHTNKSEKIENDDHRGAGKGAVEMHSTVESNKYGRLCKESEIKMLADKGECLDPSQYMMVRGGKTNLHRQDKRPRLLKKIDDGAPVCITRKLGLLGIKAEKNKDGFTRATVKLQLLAVVKLLQQDHGKTITAGGLQTMLEKNDLDLAKNFPALGVCNKEASKGDEWKASTMLGELVREGCLVSNKHGNGTAYSYVRQPASNVGN